MPRVGDGATGDKKARDWSPIFVSVIRPLASHSTLGSAQESPLEIAKMKVQNASEIPRVSIGSGSADGQSIGDHKSIGGGWDPSSGACASATACLYCTKMVQCVHACLPDWLLLRVPHRSLAPSLA